MYVSERLGKANNLLSEAGGIGKNDSETNAEGILVIIMRRLYQMGIIAIALFFAARLATSQTPDHPERAVPDPGVVTTRQSITPAGVQSVFSGRVYGVAFGSSSDTLYVAVNSGAIYELNWRNNQVLRIVRGAPHPGMQGLVLDPRTQEPLLSGSLTNASLLMRISGDQEVVIADHLGTFAVGGLAAAAEENVAGERVAAVALTFNDVLAVVDLTSGKLKGKVKTGIAPFGVVMDKSGAVAYVSNWGGRFPQPKDVTSPSGEKPDADQVVVDKRGIASTGTVVRVDLTSMKVTNEVAVGLHPTALQWDEPHARLYVANSNSDSISVVNTQTHQVAQTISLQPFARKVAGIAPNALAVSADGKTLYVACGGINAVAVIRTADGHLEGLIPTAWYPNDLRLSPGGNYLAVANLMGVGPGGHPTDIARQSKQDHLKDIQPGPTRRYVHSDRSSVQVIRIPDAAQLSGFTTAVIENNKMLAGNPGAAASSGIHAGLKPLPVPVHAGDPSLIDHVVFIIKENRPYDQVFGDLAQANSDPTLLVYGPDATPNQHRLAEQFVVLDNFYATGGNSADGHQWLTQAAETDYVYWPGYGGRSYPYDGNDPIAPASSGFIWDAALSRKRTVEDFGEYVGVPFAHERRGPQRAQLMDEWKKGTDFTGRFHVVAPLAPLNKILAKDYPYWTLAVPDVVRAQIFLKHLQGWEKNGSMPNLVLVQLPNDHTAGTDPNMPVPQGLVADNDLALGQIVAGLSRSPFWKSMAILVVEDDAQNGLDHVDGHRTVALAISPYICRGSVDSTFYSQTSMVKTIELMLGLPTLSVFDLIANDMRNSFQSTPDLTPYDAVAPRQSLEEMNPPANTLKGAARQAALASMKMNFDLPDAAPTDKLNRILWHQARGWHTPYPRAGQAIFAPYSIDLDDQEKEARDAERNEEK
jgi:YVTN family beta-propeller protein